MEFGFYLLLILALVFVAGLMLYIRFSTSRDKALHHAPLNVAPGEPETSELESEIIEPAVEEVETEESVPNQLPAIRAEAIESEKKDDERKSEYLDELQEAAAGLAMLMRSSASNRTTPVVFAPEEGEETTEAVAVEKSDIEEESEVVEAETEPEVEVEVEVEEISITEPEEKTLSVLLGEEVADRFDQLDSDLEILEALVTDIESGLSVLVPLDQEGSVAEGSDDIELTEAA